VALEAEALVVHLVPERHAGVSEVLGRERPRTARRSQRLAGGSRLASLLRNATVRVSLAGVGRNS
jgi:hypothetical protein